MNSTFESKWHKALKAGGPACDYANGYTCNETAMTLLGNELLKVLDVGGGPGTWAVKLADSFSNFKVTSLDLDATHQGKLQSVNEVTYTQGDAHDLPFKDESFDVVYVSHCFEHLIAPMLALQEFNRVLGQLGCLLLITPHVTESWLNDANHVNVLTPEQQNALCVKAGFERVYLNQNAGDASYVAMYMKVKTLD